SRGGLDVRRAGVRGGRGGRGGRYARGGREAKLLERALADPGLARRRRRRPRGAGRAASAAACRAENRGVVGLEVLPRFKRRLEPDRLGDLTAHPAAAVGGVLVPIPVFAE